MSLFILDEIPTRHMSKAWQRSAWRIASWCAWGPIGQGRWNSWQARMLYYGSRVYQQRELMRRVIYRACLKSG